MLRSPRKYNQLHGFFVLQAIVPSYIRKELYAVLEVDSYPLVEHPLYAVDVEQLARTKRGTGSYEIFMVGGGFDSYKDLRPASIKVVHHPSHIT